MIPEELKPYLPEWIIVIFAIIGFFIVLVTTIEFLFKKFPVAKRGTYDLLADWTKNKSLVKQAKTAKVEETLNDILAGFQEELPLGWVRQVSVKWVSKLDPLDLKEGDAVLRVEISESQDNNLLSSVFRFFSSSLFPGLKEVIPSSVRDSVSLQFSRRVVEEQHPYLSKVFTEELLESQINKEKELVEFLEDFRILDEKGFLSAIFIRELNEIGMRARHKPLRNIMKAEASSLAKHSKLFIEEFEDDNSSEDEVWFREGPETSYAIILVADEQKSRFQGVKPYVNRAHKWEEQNIERLYILGASKQRKFANKVINAIASLSGYTLAELFDTNRDYRGKKGGVGAVFVAKKR